MIKQLKEHETFIRQSLNFPLKDIEWLSRYHKQQISYFEHERLVHLLVTLFFGLFLLISFLATIILTDKALILVLDFLFLLLIIPYIFHYYGLENGVQRLYKLDRELEFLTGRMNN